MRPMPMQTVDGISTGLAELGMKELTPAPRDFTLSCLKGTASTCCSISTGSAFFWLSLTASWEVVDVIVAGQYEALAKWSVDALVVEDSREQRHMIASGWLSKLAYVHCYISR